MILIILLYITTFSPIAAADSDQRKIVLPSSPIINSLINANNSNKFLSNIANHLGNKTLNAHEIFEQSLEQLNQDFSNIKRFNKCNEAIILIAQNTANQIVDSYRLRSNQ